MPQEVGNLLQAGSGQSELRRRRPSQNVCPVILREAGADEGLLDRMSDDSVVRGASTGARSRTNTARLELARRACWR